MKFLIVTGMSGAGKSYALKCLEDMGFYCIDNMPPRLINQFIELSEIGKGEVEKAAFVIDIRGGEFFDDLIYSLKDLKTAKSDFKILFLEASDESLVRRYQESRRNHPMTYNGAVLDGVRLERERLQKVRNKADFIVDTSQMRPNQLRHEIQNILDYTNGVTENVKFPITIMSFGYKHGIPLDADNVFDVRFIPNPFYLKSMKKLTGNNQKVFKYVMKWDETDMFINSLEKMIESLIPYYIQQGKASLFIAFGCTGGQHRSVAVANKFHEILKDKGYRVDLIHRDL